MHTCTMHIIVSWKTQKRNLSSRSHEGLWPWHIRTNSLKLHDYTSIIIVITVNIVIIPTMYSLLTWHDLKPACEGMSTLDLWQPPSMPHLWRSTKNVSPWNFFLAQRFWKWLWIPWNVQPKFPQMGELCRWELCRWELCSFAVVQMGVVQDEVKTKYEVRWPLLPSLPSCPARFTWLPHRSAKTVQIREFPDFLRILNW